MKIQFNQTVLLSTALMLVLTSCGKSKDLKSNSQPAPITAELTQAPPPTPSPAPAQNQALPAPPTQSTTEQPNSDGEVLPPLPSAPNTPNANLPTPSGSDQIPEAPAQQGANPVALKNLDKTAQNAYEIDFKGQPSTKTGGLAKDLFYTSAGNEDLMEEFKSYGTRVSKEQQSMNNFLAKAVVAAKLSRGNSETVASAQMILNLSLNEFGEIKNYRLLANSEGEAMKLTLSKQGTTGDTPFQGGFVKCLDVDGGCDVAYAKLKFAGGYTRLIFRNSFSDMHFLVQNNVTDNARFSVWSNYVLNAANALDTTQRIDFLQLSSYEVVSGSAGMGALLTTLDHEMLGLNIPMVVSGKDSEVSAVVSQLSDLANSYDLPGSSGYSQNLSQKVNQIKLVNNNGRGQFKLQLSFGTPEKPASIWIVVSRVKKEILSIEQIRLFESQLKNF